MAIDGARLCIDESIGDDGASARTWIARDGDDLVLVRDGAPEVSLPEDVLVGVMRRYAKPLASDIVVTGESLRLPSGGRLTRLRHLARYDVIARDWLVLELAGEEPVAELATAIAAALRRLASLAAASRAEQ